MGIDYLFDTNILIYLLNNCLAENLPSGRYGYSVITEIELLSFPALTATDMEIINTYLGNIVLMNLTEAIKQKTISLRRTYRIKLPDAIIAATAIEAGAVLLTNDKALHAIENIACLSLQVKQP
ncbi:MAG: PIN domain-containing protein [Methylovulum sp.]|nr:PIN domain-containing protein [Methylovulum sp.]